MWQRATDCGNVPHMERTEQVRVRLHSEEKERIKANADLAGTSLSEYVRVKALGGDAKPESQPEQPGVPSRDSGMVREEIPVQDEKNLKLAIIRHVSQGKTKAHAERLAREELDA